MKHPLIAGAGIMVSGILIGTVMGFVAGVAASMAKQASSLPTAIRYERPQKENDE